MIKTISAATTRLKPSPQRERETLIAWKATYGALAEWYKAKDPKLSEKQLRSAIKSLSDKVKAEYKGRLMLR